MPSARLSAIGLALGLTAGVTSSAAWNGEPRAALSLVSSTPSTSTIPIRVKPAKIPAVTICRRQSTTRTPAGAATPAPAATTRPSRMTTVPPSIGAVPSPINEPGVGDRHGLRGGGSADRERRDGAKPEGPDHFTSPSPGWPSSKFGNRASLRILGIVEQRTVDPHHLGPRIDAERIAVPQHHIGHLPWLEAAGPVGDPQRLGGVDRHPFPRGLLADGEAGTDAGGARLGDFLVEPLDAVLVVRMDHRARALLFQDGEILLDRVIGFHLEAVPIGPDRGAGAAGLEQVGDLVGLHRMVERRDVVAELPSPYRGRWPSRRRDSSGSERGSRRRARAQRVHRDVAGGRIAALLLIFLPAALILHRARPGGAIDRDVAHSRRRLALLGAIDALGILAARHLEA